MGKTYLSHLIIITMLYKEGLKVLPLELVGLKQDVSSGQLFIM